MTAIPAEVVSAHRLLNQHHVIVRIGAAHYRDSFATLNLDFHFRSRSNRLDAGALGDLDRLVDLLANRTYQQRHVLLFGFTDNAGGARADLALSKSRARAVGEQLQMRGITPSLVDGYGKALPIAPNDTESGREKNRRVEVWLH